MPRLDLNLYAGENGQNHRFSAIGATSSQGLVNIIIPILIAALIVLNTMLGSVFERVKEIAHFLVHRPVAGQYRHAVYRRGAGLRRHRRGFGLLDRAGPC